jgi:hypothetical protein
VPSHRVSRLGVIALPSVARPEQTLGDGRAVPTATDSALKCPD